MRYLDKYDILSCSQYGFRKRLSTQDAILDLTSLIAREIDKGKKVLAIFLDLKKAFDTASVPILVRRLKGIGIRGTALSLFTSYLQNRSQKVKIDGYYSDECEVIYGVPQGSVLGPTLFLIYINELCNLGCAGGRIFSYADDTAIVFTGGSWLEVESVASEGLRRVYRWLTDNLLTLNIQKTNYICFSTYQSFQPEPNFLIRIHNCLPQDSLTCNCPYIEKVSFTKYLGVIIDQRLSWHPHLELLMCRVRKLIWIFKALRHVMDRKLCTKIYVALAQSVITYCIPIWGGATKSNLIDLERAQRSLIKVLCFKSFRFPTDHLYIFSDLLSVRRLYIINLILKYHKSLPYNPNVLNKRRHDIVARVHPVRTAFAKRQYECQSPFLYNKINKELNIYPMTLFTCKITLDKWLKELTFEEVELFLCRTI